MKHLNYTYRELVHHLDMYSTDPLVRKLIEFIVSGEDSVMSGLIDVGMDPTTYEFSDSYEYFTPGDYIEHLRKNCDYMEQDLYVAREDLEEEQEKRKRLETRTVAELLAHMEEIVKRTKSDADNVNRMNIKLEQENDNLKDKINVWSIMERQ